MPEMKRYQNLVCAVCGVTFDAGEKTQETCSLSCGRTLFHRRRKEKLGRPKKCAHCGVEWIAMPKDTHKFCSWGCHAADKGHQGLRHAECEFCGTKFDTYRRPNKDGKGRFCSKRCWYESAKTRVAKICECCEVNFEVLKCQSTQRFCSKKCENEFLSGERHWGFRGKFYEYISSKGFVMSRPKGEIKMRPKHRLLVEQAIGRKLANWEIVIHIDGNKLNNKLENYYLFHSRADWVRVQQDAAPWPTKSNLQGAQ